MLDKIKSLTKTDTIKDTFIMTVATAISAVLAAFFFIIIARLLGPENFGLFSLATAASFMFSDIFDLSINTSLVRFVGKEITRDIEKAKRYMKFIFNLKLKISMILIVLILVLSKQLSVIFFTRELPLLIILVGVGTAFNLFLSFAIANHQAQKQFIKAGIGIILAPLFRFVGLLILLLIKTVNVMGNLVAYFFATPFAFVITLFLSPVSFFKVQKEQQVARKFFKYSLPLTAGFALTAIGSRVDNFILANMFNSEAVGYYSAAFRLFSPLQYMTGTLSSVFAPRFASFENHEKAKNYFLKTVLLIGGLSLFVLFVLPFSPLIIKLFYGDEYLPSIPIFNILLFGFASFMVQVPFTSLVLYYLAKPKVFTYTSLIQLFTIILLNLILIPIFGARGSAYSFLITQIITIIILAIYSLKSLNKQTQ